MIRIAGRQVDAQAAFEGAPQSGVERSILNDMLSSGDSYDYDDLSELRFELSMRGATVNAAQALDRSEMDFSIFRKSRCNPVYWNRTGDGGFQLKRDAQPSAAIRDIFENGQAYATECATAIVIVYYKAALDTLSAQTFDRLFPHIVLMNWHHVDPLLRGIGLMRRAERFLPGDRMYFANPDVNPVRPEWQGENVILLGEDLYYGHGIGIENGASIIRALNENRVEDAQESAYLIKRAGWPDYRELMDAAGRQA